MRLFVAIEFPPEVKDALAVVAAQLERQADSSRVVPRDNFHLTLVFIGETRRVDEACAVFQQTARMEFIEPLELALDGFGTFKAKGKGGGRGNGKTAGGAHTWWVGVAALPTLSTLAAAFAEAYRAEGFSIEPRAFRPHVTLARGVRASRPIELSLPPLITTASHVSLMKSDLSGDRPVYTSLLAVPSHQSFCRRKCGSGTQAMPS